MDDIYLDHAATTPIHKKVLEAMDPIYNDVFGNPSSIHSYGRKARHVLDESRATVAKSINADEKTITFTSGGTEANNLALIGVALANATKGKHIITTNQEHQSVLQATKHLESLGFQITYVPVDETGIVAVQDISDVLTDETILVSVMYANNETGAIQPIEAIGELLQGHQAYFHTDAVQVFGLLDIDVKNLAIDLLTISSHKINGPKGNGALYAADHVQMESLQYGGKQERLMRPGTENVAGIVGFSKAVEIAIKEQATNNQTYKTYKTAFINKLKECGIMFTVNGAVEKTIASIINISFPGTHVEAMLMNLDLDHIAASSGSACTAGSLEPSYVLAAMFGKGHEKTKNSIRFSFGMNQSVQMIEEAAGRIANIVDRLTK